MAFKTVNSLDADTTISLGGVNKKTKKQNPTKVEGYYLGNRQVDDVKKKSGFSYIYFFQTEKGNIGVWGKTDLDRKMRSVAAGVMTRVTVTGTVPTPNGDMYKFSVEIDDANTIDVDPALSAAAYQEEEESSEESNEEEDADQEAAYAAALSAAEKKAKVLAQLKSKN